jgi:hypothetical protein
VELNGVITDSPVFGLQVRRPKELFPKAVVGHATDATNVVDAEDKAFGYESLIHYQIRDQTGAVLPRPVPLNEQFTSGLSCDYMHRGGCGTNWRFQQNCDVIFFARGNRIRRTGLIR